MSARIKYRPQSNGSGVHAHAAEGEDRAARKTAHAHMPLHVATEIIGYPVFQPTNGFERNGNHGRVLRDRFLLLPRVSPSVASLQWI